MVRIRRTEDLQAVHELDRITFPGDKPTLEKEATHEWWLAEDAGGPVGFLGLHLGSSSASITRVGVVGSARGNGLQKRLMRTAIQFARRRGIARVCTYVMATNIPSLRSLLAVGFKPYRTTTKNGAYFIELETQAAS